MRKDLLLLTREQRIEMREEKAKDIVAEINRDLRRLKLVKQEIELLKAEKLP